MPDKLVVKKESDGTWGWRVVNEEGVPSAAAAGFNTQAAAREAGKKINSHLEQPKGTPFDDAESES